MTQTTLEVQLARWQRALLFYAGATAALLVIVLVELPALAVARQASRAVVLDGWYGVFLILLLATLAPGILLLLAPVWRALPLRLRLNTGFGYLGCAWMALAACDLRLAALDLPAAFHIIVFGLGIVLVLLYLLLRRRHAAGGELFP